MEEANKRVYDPDLEDDKEKERDKKDEEPEKKKANRKPAIKVDSAFLVDNPMGLSLLYKRLVAGDQLQLKGKGHEVSDLNRVLKVIKGWQFDARPKFEFADFAVKMQKAGADKGTKPFLNKLRMVYKGLEVLDEFQPEL